MSTDPGASDRNSIDTNDVPPTQIVVPPPNPPASPPPGREDKAASKAGFSVPTLLASVVFSIGAGALGAWAYEKYAAKPKADDAPRVQTAAETPPAFPESAGNALRGEFGTLQGRMVRLEERLSAIPKDQPLADVDALKEKVATLERSIGEKSIDEKMGALDSRAAKAEKERDDLRSEIASLRQAFDADHTAIVAMRRPPPDLDAVRRDAAKPAVEDINVDGQALSEGAQLLEKKQYADAREVFRKLEENHPLDARAWYYSALATGFATGDWRGQAERLVEKGIEREKAGTPDKAAIDATFSNLSKEAGKDWLNAYRQRAR